ncbi:endonuclease [Streptomyces albireticuli]|uniref:Endonuclease n=1 Tax=Streptomyces albireticuli TaxID=1940 RepID=A0A1Z2LCA3_9ACTN|nr:endonuclease/exonuclease/phosphatase family protein [Streptomyces albireticuli]ARZ71934.1 endonuclease [Streptomyces albireticuli]
MSASVPPRTSRLPLGAPLTRRTALRVTAATVTGATAAGTHAAPAGAVSTSAPATETATVGSGPATGAPRGLRVMTFNLRYASETGPHPWSERRPVMRRLLRRERPHLLGTQEGLHGQLRDLAEDLGPRYGSVGLGRSGGSHDEFVAVLYDTERLVPEEYDHFWLSATPSLIGSATWGNTVVRMATWVRFTDRRTGAGLYALNTHLDHAHQYARERSAALLTERLRGLDPALPRIVTGDFNVPAHRNPVYDAMLDRGALADTWDTAAERGPQYATFHGYRPLVPDGDRIDWILASPSVRVSRADINTFSEHGRFPSDHLPVQALLEL